jgi:hypothetical protein
MRYVYGQIGLKMAKRGVHAVECIPEINFMDILQYPLDFLFIKFFWASLTLSSAKKGHVGHNYR